jgi:Tfp pilus assembly protein PilV
MRRLELQTTHRSRARAEGFTLAEVVMSIFIAAVVFCGVIGAYVQAAYRAEWSGYSLAAQALAIQQLEQAKAGVWDNQTCNITNLNTVTSATLDLPVPGSSTNSVYATNYTTITSITNLDVTQVTVYMVKVDTVWPFLWKNRVVYYTNTVADYYAPDMPSL